MIQILTKIIDSEEIKMTKQAFGFVYGLIGSGIADMKLTKQATNLIQKCCYKVNSILALSLVINHLIDSSNKLVHARSYNNLKIFF